MLAASLGLLSLLRLDLHRLAVALIEHFGLRPSEHYPSIVLHYSDVLANTDLRSLVLLATAYVVLRFAEAYGLWYQRTWGQWLGALSGVLYVPFELLHLAHRPSVPGVVVLIGNLLAVGFLVYVLWREQRDRHAAGPDD